MIRARIRGTGHYLPKNVVTNFDLEKVMDTSDEWIRQRTGIVQRHMVSEGEATSDLAANAAEIALRRAEVSPEDVDYIICATVTPDYFMPGSASLVQKKLGAKRAGACDVNAACSGFIYSLQIADALIRSGVHKTILVIGAEALSVRLDYTHRDSAVLFGDGAGAVVIQAEEGDRGVLATYVAADGDAYEVLYMPSGGSRQVITPENVGEIDRGVIMNGRELYKRAVFAFQEAIETVLARSGIRPEEIDLFVPHQANRRIILSAVERLGMPEEKVYMNLDRVANTSAASIPIALDQAADEGLLKSGDLVLLAAFGAGLTWASAIVRW